MENIHNAMHQMEFKKRTPPLEHICFIKIYGELNDEAAAEHTVRSDTIVNMTKVNGDLPFTCLVRLFNGDVIKSHTTIDEILKQTRKENPNNDTEEN